MNSRDKDYRYMATLDLTTELEQEHFRLEPSSQKRLVQQILKLVDDTSNDVQEVAAKCLGPLVATLNEELVVFIADSLTTNLLNEDKKKDELRDISSMSMKTVFNAVGQTSGLARQVVARVLPRLLQGVAVRDPPRQPQQELHLLDTLCELLDRLGTAATEQHHKDVLAAVFPIMSSLRAASRKRATHALALLASVAKDSVFGALMDQLLAALDKAKRPAGIRTMVQCLAAVSKAVGYRVGRHLKQAVPLVLRSCTGDADAQGSDDELREHCLQCFETLIVRCPREVTDHLPDILKASLALLKFDPNYADDDDDDDADMDDDDDDEMTDAMDDDGGDGDSDGGGGDDDDDDDDYFDDDFSDDDDMSWKVRRAAARCVEAMVRTRPDLLSSFLDDAGPALVRRFDEREETVKLDVFAAFTALLRQTLASSSGQSSSSSLAAGSTTPGGDSVLSQSTGGAALTMSQGGDGAMLEGAGSHADALSSLAALRPRLVAALRRQLKHKSIKVRCGVFSLLRALVAVHAQVLDERSVNRLLPAVDAAVRSARQDASKAGAKQTTTTSPTAGTGGGINSALHIEALQFLRGLFESAPATQLLGRLDTLTGLLLPAVEDGYYRVSAEGLRAVASLIRSVRPVPSRTSGAPLAPLDNGLAQAVGPLYTAVRAKLALNDVDQDVKEQSIACMGVLLAHTGDAPAMIDGLNDALAVLLERLRNEITRLTTVRVLGAVCRSVVPVDLSSVLGELTRELAALLRQADRSLRLAALDSLAALARAHGSSKDCHAQFKAAVKECAPLVTDADLTMAALALRACRDFVVAHSKCAETVRADVLPLTLHLLQSSLVQGAALDAASRLCAALVTASAKGTSFDQVYGALTRLVTESKESLSKQSVAAVAQCAAAAVCAAPADQHAAAVADSVGQLLDAAAGGADKINQMGPSACTAFRLRLLGEIGWQAPLASEHAVPLQGALLAHFDAAAEEVKQAAAFAFGNVAAGSLGVHLPVLLRELQAHPAKQYLLLHAVRETIGRRADMLMSDAVTAAASPAKPATPGGKKSGAKKSRTRSRKGSSAPATGAAPSPSETLAAYLELLTTVLQGSAENEEEGIRNVVAECLGKLALLYPAEMVAPVATALSAKHGLARSTAISALKHAVVARAHPVDAHLAPLVHQILSALSDPELAVRKAAVLFLNYAAHNKPALVRSDLQNALAALYKETRVKPELIRVVELGPFKHKVDDGLEVRKCAFECMYTLLASSLDLVNVPDFIDALAGGLGDEHDIKMLSHLLVVRLAEVAGDQLLSAFASLTDPIRKTILHKLPDSAVKQDVERNDELIRSALRAVHAVARVPGADDCVPLQELIADPINVNGNLTKKWKEIQEV